MRRIVWLVLVTAVVGCGKKPKGTDSQAPADPSPPPRTTAPPPEDSGADRAPGAATWASGKSADGPGYPNRLLCTISKAVRGDTVVQVLGAGKYVGDDFVVLVAVKSRGPAPLAFKSWHDASAVTLKDNKGKAYPRRLADPEDEAIRKSFAENRPGEKAGYWSGPVTPDRMRVSFICFDRAAAAAVHLDVDLDGKAIGTTDPILFRIPKEVWADHKW